jgi:hypothetical protein
VSMCSVLLPPGGNPTAVNKYININIYIYIYISVQKQYWNELPATQVEHTRSQHVTLWPHLRILGNRILHPALNVIFDQLNFSDDQTRVSSTRPVSGPG